ncbi:Uma2 family endonuclease [candidate division KSB1 bacterium]|nr:Uma2 family endonuclease [candidate division KSB1 bacterium]
MEVITTQETAGPKTSASKNGEAALLKKSALPLEERTDLTISEVEALGLSDSYELIDGRIIFKMATSDHSYIQLKLAAAFDAYLEAHPIGMAFTELSVRIFPDDDRNFRTPDLAFCLNNNLPVKGEMATTAPDLAVEIITPASDFPDVLEKADLYLSKGSKVVWIVIPTKACVLILTASGRRWEYETLTCPELLPGWSLNLQKIFNWPEPKAAA